ncbi:DegT/DnrJ/EryC1/StrS family aminotransferase [Treponema pedis]|uniref:DegT/DnrJ/EryC1/StrS aminotransferase family protein n=1 Tax=Treponema pedis TaxID=409322 RepID=A0A7S6WMG1_9SPIR|nr:DegT/DnrJ/EryC1/StrS family aminotransferase [Treponema pedis]QOW59838.1 DegT/DnrJ/EryC1/StrS aminotransferase family protein [Treponema pedis]
MKIPVYSSTIRRSEMDAVLTCMVEEKIGPGEMSQKLIKQICETFSVSGAAAFRSPAIALNYALSALNLEEGSEIIISALAPSWQYTELQRKKFKPAVIDVQQDNALINFEAVEAVVQSGGRALILHETLGFLPDIEKILTLNIPVIEDISQSAGAVYKERPAGSLGVFSILGLEEKDILTGGGGAVLLAPERRNSIILKRLYDEAPVTDLLPDINASLAFVQLRQMGKNMDLRKEMNEAYVRSIMQGKHKTIPLTEGSTNPVYSFPVILNSGAADVQKYAAKKNIEIEAAFKNSVVDYLKKSEENKENQEAFINAASLLLRCVLFPLYPRLGAKKSAEIAKVLATLP